MISHFELRNVGTGDVYLIAGGDRCYTDIAARFVSSERPVKEIISSPYDKKLVENIIKRGHLAATEFDYWIFGVEGYSRVTEVQLVRKRMASYLIKSGRAELHGKRKFSMVAPKEIYAASAPIKLDTYDYTTGKSYTEINLTGADICNIIDQWYMHCLYLGYKEEDLRYLKPQATEFKAIIGMDTHALIDFFERRMCNKAQFEIRDMATKMYKICKDLQPDLFANAGPSCKVSGFCPENDNQCDEYKGKIPTLNKVRDILKNYSE